MSNPTRTHKLASALLDYLHQSGKTSLSSNFLKDLKTSLAPTAAINFAVLTTAKPLDKTELALVKSYVYQKTGGTTKLSLRLDPSLLAGYRLKIGDELIDASLSSKLEILHRELR